MDDSFILVDSISFLSPKEILRIAKKNPKYLGIILRKVSNYSRCVYSLESHYGGNSKENTQHTFI